MVEMHHKFTVFVVGVILFHVCASNDVFDTTQGRVIQKSDAAELFNSSAIFGDLINENQSEIPVDIDTRFRGDTFPDNREISIGQNNGEGYHGNFQQNLQHPNNHPQSNFNRPQFNNFENIVFENNGRPSPNRNIYSGENGNDENRNFGVESVNRGNNQQFPGDNFNRPHVGNNGFGNNKDNFQSQNVYPGENGLNINPQHLDGGSRRPSTYLQNSHNDPNDHSQNGNTNLGQNRLNRNPFPPGSQNYENVPQGQYGSNEFSFVSDAPNTMNIHSNVNDQYDNQWTPSNYMYPLNYQDNSNRQYDPPHRQSNTGRPTGNNFPVNGNQFVGGGLNSRPVGGNNYQQGFNNPQIFAYPITNYQQKPNRNFGTQPNSNFINQPNSNFGNQPNINFGNQPNNNYENQPNINFANQPDSNFGHQPNSMFVKQLNSNFGNQPSSNFGNQPYSNFGNQLNSNFMNQPNSNFGKPPNTNFGNQPNSNFGNVYSAIPNENINVGDSPIQFPGNLNGPFNPFTLLSNFFGNRYGEGNESNTTIITESNTLVVTTHSNHNTSSAVPAIELTSLPDVEDVTQMNISSSSINQTKEDSHSNNDHLLDEVDLEVM